MRIPSLAVVAGALLFTLAAGALGQAFRTFVVKDIRVEGLQRTEPGTVFSYLPVKVGETMTEEKAQQALRALFATGFFRDVRLEVENDVLVVMVEERPAIAQIDFVGMKEFELENLRRIMRDVGLADGRTFDRAVLDHAEQELKRQYLSRGRYAAEVQTTVTPLERNRVGISITVTEGDVAKIRSINIVGDQAFSEKELLDQFVLRTPGWLTWYTKHDQYSKPQAGGRPRNAQVLLPEPRLPRFQRRIDPGLDHARTSATSTSRSTSSRARSTRSRRSSWTGRCWCRARSSRS